MKNGSYYKKGNSGKQKNIKKRNVQVRLAQK